MKYERTSTFKRAFAKFPDAIKRTFEKQATFLLQDIRYPSLHAKKYGGTTDIWQARVTDCIRFYFKIVDHTYVLLNIIKHPK